MQKRSFKIHIENSSLVHSSIYTLWLRKISLVFHFKYQGDFTLASIGAFVNIPKNMHSEFSLQEWQVKLGSIWFLNIEDSHPWSCTLWGITQNFTFIKAQSHTRAMSMSMKPYHIRIGGIHNFNGYTKSTFSLCAVQHLCHGVSVWHKASLVQSRSAFSLLSYCMISVLYQMLMDILHAKGYQYALVFRSYSWLSGKGAGKQKFQLDCRVFSQVHVVNGLEFWYS